MKKSLILLVLFLISSCGEVKKKNEIKNKEFVEIIQDEVIKGYRYRVIKFRGVEYFESGLSKSMIKLNKDAEKR